MPSLKKVKSADNESKDVVFGYVREVDKSMENTNIPAAISCLCLAFYYFPEYFAKAREDKFKISDDKLTIISIDNCSYENHSIYMNKWINSQSNKIIKWTFKINNKGRDCLYFGLASTYSDDLLQNDFINEYHPNYSVSNNNHRYMNGKFYDDEESRILYTYSTGANVIYTLNLKNKTFSCQRDNENDIVSFKNIKCGDGIRYRLAMQLPSKHDSVTLLDFDCSF